MRETQHRTSFNDWWFFASERAEHEFVQWTFGFPTDSDAFGFLKKILANQHTLQSRNFSTSLIFVVVVVVAVGWHETTPYVLCQRFETLYAKFSSNKSSNEIFCSEEISFECSSIKHSFSQNCLLNFSNHRHSYGNELTTNSSEKLASKAHLYREMNNLDEYFRRRFRENRCFWLLKSATPLHRLLHIGIRTYCSSKIESECINFGRTTRILCVNYRRKTSISRNAMCDF